MPRAKKPVSQSFDVPNDPPSKVTKPKYACSDDAKWGGFLNKRLTEDEVDEFNLWLPGAQADAGWEIFAEAVQQGLKFSLSYDVQNSAWIATFTGDLLQINDRRAITSRAETWGVAVMLAVFKHAVLLEGDYSSLITSTNDRMKFG